MGTPPVSSHLSSFALELRQGRSYGEQGGQLGSVRRQRPNTISSHLSSFALELRQGRSYGEQGGQLGPVRRQRPNAVSSHLPAFALTSTVSTERISEGRSSNWVEYE